MYTVHTAFEISHFHNPYDEDDDDDDDADEDTINVKGGCAFRILKNQTKKTSHLIYRNNESIIMERGAREEYGHHYIILL